MDYGIKLRRIRIDKKLTQKEVCEFLEISQKTYSNIENNKSMLGLDQFHDLSIYLNFNIAHFFDIKNNLKSMPTTKKSGTEKVQVSELLENYNKLLRNQERVILNLRRKLKKLSS